MAFSVSLSRFMSPGVVIGAHDRVSTVYRVHMADKASEVK